jgi:hypothetical protein
MDIRSRIVFLNCIISKENLVKMIVNHIIKELFVKFQKLIMFSCESYLKQVQIYLSIKLRDMCSKMMKQESDFL